MKANYMWKTACIIRETSDATSIIFDTGEDEFNFFSGQFVNLSLKIKNKIVTRSYSLCSAADEDEKPTITVKRVQGGVMSNYIVDHAEEIAEWQIEGPYGSFYPAENVMQAENIILIAGGSGITPIFSILKYYLKHTSADVILINANRTKDDVIFKISLAYMEQLFKHRFIIWNCFSGAAIENDRPAEKIIKERLSKLLLKKLLKTLLADKLNQAAYFICGPSGFLQMSGEALVSLNVQTGLIYKEHFNLPEEPEKKMKLPRKTLEVLLHHYDQTLLVQVKPRNTI
ncbi:MAG: FAD-binding oxidoreductase, partial [Bacteroidota bacterium]